MDIIVKECQSCYNNTQIVLNCGCSTVCCPECFSKWAATQQSSVCICGKKYLTYKQLHTHQNILSMLNTFNFWKKTNRFTNRPYVFEPICCRDFVESDGKCLKCFKTTCGRCLRHGSVAATAFSDNNTCDTPNKCASTLYNTLKNCPNCLAYVEKQEGCSEMFCVGCFTSFNFSTGTLGNIIARHSLTNSHFDDNQLATAFKYVPAICKTVIPIVRIVMFEMDHYIGRSTSTFNEWSYYYDLKTLLEDCMCNELKLLSEANRILKSIPINDVRVFAHLDLLSKTLLLDQSAQVKI